MKLYHLSTENLNNKVLIPKIPYNILTKLGVENNTIPRVSFSPTISHAILAIGFNRIKSGSKTYNVYEPENYKDIKIITDNDLDTKRYVPDVDKTKEHWVVSNVKIKYVGKIKILKPKNEFILITWGPNQDQKIKNYFWEYKVLDGDIS